MYRIPSTSKGGLSIKQIQSLIDSSIRINNNDVVKPYIDSEIQEIKNIIFNLINNSYYVEVYKTDEPNVYEDLRGVKYRSDNSSNRSVNDVKDKNRFTIFEYIKLPNGTIQHITSPVQYNLFNVNQIEYRTNVNPDYCCVFNRTLDVSVDCILTLDSHSFVNNNQSMFDNEHIQFKNIVVNTSYDLNKHVIKNSLCNRNQCNQITFNNCCNFDEPIRLFQTSDTKSIYVNNSEDVTSISGGFVSLKNCNQLKTIHYNKLQDCSEFIVGQLEELFENTSYLNSITNMEYNNTILDHYTLYRSNLWYIESFTNSIQNLTAVGQNNIYYLHDLNMTNMFSKNRHVLIDGYNFNNCNNIVIDNVDFSIDNRLDGYVLDVFSQLDDCSFDGCRIYLEEPSKNNISNIVYRCNSCDFTITNPKLAPRQCIYCAINYVSKDSIEDKNNFGYQCENSIFYLNTSTAIGVCKSCINCKIIGTQLSSAQRLCYGEDSYNNKVYLPVYIPPDDPLFINWNGISKVYGIIGTGSGSTWLSLMRKYNPSCEVSLNKLVVSEFRQLLTLGVYDDVILFACYKSTFYGSSSSPSTLTNSRGYDCMNTTIEKNLMTIPNEDSFWVDSLRCEIIP